MTFLGAIILPSRPLDPVAPLAYEPADQLLVRATAVHVGGVEERLASASPRDKRISYGCINVSEAFYDAFIRPVFTASSGIVYILPGSQPLTTLFPVHAAATAIGKRPAGHLRGG
jgi:hypothetical protein